MSLPFSPQPPSSVFSSPALIVFFKNRGQVRRGEDSRISLFHLRKERQLSVSAFVHRLFISVSHPVNALMSRCLTWPSVKVCAPYENHWGEFKLIQHTVNNLQYANVNWMFPSLCICQSISIFVLAETILTVYQRAEIYRNKLRMVWTYHIKPLLQRKHICVLQSCE